MADKTGNTRVVRKRCARSCAHKPLPPPPGGLASDAVTLLLFYQYIEPQWSKAQHKKALAFVIGLGTKLGLTGRGRCAAEGLNCTITGAPQAVRSFCVGLRQWNPVFLDTDFKLTDGLAAKEKFKALTIRKTDELVAYGLAGNDAERPSLSNNITKHVEAHKYHKMMGKKNT
jgi:predicted sulfurtransferase